MDRLIWFGPTGMLLLALASLPYGYYGLLRFVVCGVAAYLAWKHYEAVGVHPWTVTFLVVALLFNPLAKVHLSRELWAIADVACAILFFVNFKVMRPRIIGSIGE